MNSRSRETLDAWTEESRQDRRNTRWAFVIAVAAHALFFRLELPDTAAAEHARANQPVFVMETIRFEPPPPREQQTLPEPRARRVPVPDPTPDDPEPIAPREEVVVSVDLGQTDLLLGLPEAPPPELPAGPMRVGGDVLPPAKIHAPAPRYPEIARAARFEGDVTVEAVIDAAGVVTRLRILQSQPLGLDEAALDAVRKWRFEPATYNGRPVPVLYNLTIRFRLS